MSRWNFRNRRRGTGRARRSFRAEFNDLGVPASRAVPGLNAAGNVTESVPSSVRGSGQDDPEVPEVPDYRPLKLRFYSQHANPPLPPAATAADYLEYAHSQIELAHWALERAEKSARHVENYPIQAVVGEVDVLLEFYDTGIVALMRGFELAEDVKVYADAAFKILLELQPYMRAVPHIMAKAVNTAARLGYQLGWGEGYVEGWKDRDQDTAAFLEWLKDLLGNAAKGFALGGGVGVAILAALAVLAVSLGRR